MNHLRFLRYVDEIARAGSIRGAAERLHVAPSAVNRRLLDLEDELGTPIFERLPRGMRLTAAGELFIDYVRSRSAALDHVRSRIEELRGLRRGTVRVAISQALAPAFLAPVIGRFRREHPLVDFQVRVLDHGQALDALRAFEIDLALVFNLPPQPGVEHEILLEQRLYAIMHVEHPLARAGRGGVRLRECAEWPLALPDRDTGGRQMLERFLVRSSVRLRPVIESNSFEFLRSCLDDRETLSFQIAIGALSGQPELTARVVDDAGFPRGDLVLAHLAGRQLPAIAHAFAEAVRKAITRPAATRPG